MRTFLSIVAAMTTFNVMAAPAKYEITGVNNHGDFSVVVNFDDEDPGLQVLSHDEYFIPAGAITVASAGQEKTFHGLTVRLNTNQAWTWLEFNSSNGADYFQLSTGSNDIALMNATPTSVIPTNVVLEGVIYNSNDWLFTGTMEPHVPQVFTASVEGDTLPPITATSTLTLEGTTIQGDNARIEVAYDPATPSMVVSNTGYSTLYEIPEATITTNSNGQVFVMQGAIVEINKDHETFYINSIDQMAGNVHIHGHAEELDDMLLENNGEAHTIVEMANVNVAQHTPPYFYLGGDFYSLPHQDVQPSLRLATGAGCSVSDELTYVLTGTNEYGNFHATIRFNAASLIDISNDNPRFKYEIPTATIEVIRGPQILNQTGVRMDFRTMPHGGSSVSFEEISDPNGYVNQFSVDAYFYNAVGFDPLNSEDENAFGDVFYNIYSNDAMWFERAFLSGGVLEKQASQTSCQ